MLSRVSARANLIIYLVWGFAHVHGWPWNNPLTLGRFHLWSGCHRVEGGLRHISIWFSPIGQINRCNLSASVNSSAHYFLALEKPTPPPPPPLLLICCWGHLDVHMQTRRTHRHTFADAVMMINWMALLRSTPTHMLMMMTIINTVLTCNTSQWTHTYLHTANISIGAIIIAL